MYLILYHSRVILLGDLNYRVSLPEETTRLLVEKKAWTNLLQNDQVRNYYNIINYSYYDLNIIR